MNSKYRVGSIARPHHLPSSIKQNIVNLKRKNALLENELSNMKELLQKKDHTIAKLLQQSVSLEEEDELYLVQLLKKVLLANKSFSTTFIYRLFCQQLKMLHYGHGRCKWDPAIIHWMMTIQYHGGQGIIDILRGKAFQGQGQHGKLNIDTNNWGLVLPGNIQIHKIYFPSF